MNWFIYLLPEKKGPNSTSVLRMWLPGREENMMQSKVTESAGQGTAGRAMTAPGWPSVHAYI